MNGLSGTQYERSERLLGPESTEILRRSAVIIFGLGGVGSFAAEALARAGVGRLTLVDFDVVEASNINRQIVALHSTLGRPKAEVMRERVLDINPDADAVSVIGFVSPETVGALGIADYSFAVDCVDTVTAKLSIIAEAKAAGVPVISSMGTGNKLDPARFEIADIGKTSVCPLARVMRRELKARGIRDVPVLYSREEPRETAVGSGPGPVGDDANGDEGKAGRKKPVPGSVSFVPPVAGLMIAGYVVRDLVDRGLGTIAGTSPRA